MNQTPLFQQQQLQFLYYLRQPGVAQLPAGFTPERLAVYADLLYNKFDESLTACFPVIHRILPPDDWRALLLDFIAEHRCLSPYYRQIPDEFVQYLQQERDRADDLPFLAELAHFEWIELKLSIAESESITSKPLTSEQLLAGIPVFAPVMQLLHYQWPVQNIGPHALPTEPPATATHILGFRDSDDRIRFIALSPATARLIELLSDGLTGQQALQAMRGELTNAQFTELTGFGLSILTDLHRQGAIIDIRPSNRPEHHA
ncbi:HvfC family RiPP maturation protein [Methylobacter sp. YRD-M1]|uniref:HvfC family RiPP maturation protein n=1 Tax=Methylobacter sp. YRD-M1 TaxID=2911520 RepID=UPI00227D1D56|nr:putative DNA-binding domain-containing protein [Methylobacter sp. YRD-M1]WAK01029.1 putative DNA-binding domain-containing protein [Methylobacter sp. YRD-M1]